MMNQGWADQLKTPPGLVKGPSLPAGRSTPCHRPQGAQQAHQVQIILSFSNIIIPMDAQRVQLSCTPSAGKEKNKAIQHTFQVPKQWSG